MHRNGDRKQHRALLLLVLLSQQWHLPEYQKPYQQQRQIHDIVGEERGGPRNYGNEGKQILSFIVSFLYIYLYMQRVAVVGGTITAVVIIVVFPLKATTTHSTRDRGVITGPEK